MVVVRPRPFSRRRRVPLIAGAGLALLVCAHLPAPTPAHAAAPSTVRADSTPAAWTARYVASYSAVKAGGTWAPDGAVASGGSRRSVSTPVTGTSTPALFSRYRFGVTAYRVPVPAPGRYAVTYNAMEPSWTAPGQRVFDLSLEGRVRAPAVDVLASVGRYAAYTRTFGVDVTDGVLDLSFTPVTGQPIVSSVSVERLPDPARWQLPVTGLFGPASVWTQQTTSWPLATDSPALVANLAQQVGDRYGGVAGFNVWQYNIAYEVADESTPRVDVGYDDCQGKGHVPTGVLGPDGVFTGVPVPLDATPSRGSDASLSIYDPQSDTLWTFWRFRRQGDAVSACWGGRLRSVSSSLGVFEGAWGTSASGTAHEGGAIGIREVQAGAIDHALTIALPDIATDPSVSWPATRTDGADLRPDAIAMGTRLRLDPTVDVDALNLHPVARMVARAAQRYGFVVTDRAGAVSVSTESGEATRRRTGTDPWTDLLGGTPSYNVLRNFPWDRLQALERDYGRPAAVS